MSANYVVERTSTLQVAAADRAEFWAGHVRSIHCALDHRFRTRADFLGTTARQHDGRYQLVEFTSDGVAYVRTARQVARDPDEDLRLLVPLTGTLAVHDDDAGLGLGRGTAGLLSTTAPFRLAHDAPVRALILTMPRPAVPRFRPGIDSRLDLNAGVGRALAGLLTTAARERDRLGAIEFGTLCDQAVELLGLIRGVDAGGDTLAAVERAFREHVAAHSDDPTLTGMSAAHALGWSLRQVQTALQRAQTTPRDVIAEERLRRAHRRLLDPAQRHRRVAEIAFQSGFSSTGTFTEAFRRRYGITPRDLRRAPVSRSR